MKGALWMVVGSVAALLAVIPLVDRGERAAVAFGVAAPLAAMAVSWVLTERTYKRDPQRLTRVMMKGFAAKMVFFGAYVAAMLKGLRLLPVPFVASFTGCLIALYLAETLMMRRLFAGGANGNTP